MVNKKPAQANPVVTAFTLLVMACTGWVLYKIYEGRNLPANVEARAREAREDKKPYAWAYCQQLVKNSLKAPGTASFPWKIEVHASPDNVFTVDSYVDSQNSFGAMIRTRYFCQLTHTGENADAGWKVKDFKPYH